MIMKYSWTGDVKLFVPGVGTIPPHSTFEMDKDSLKMAGVKYLLKTGEIVKGDVEDEPIEEDEVQEAGTHARMDDVHNRIVG